MNILDKVLNRPYIPEWVLTGAYGRNYETKEQAVKDFAGGKDFRFSYNGPYCSIRDWSEETLLVYVNNEFVNITHQVKEARRNKNA